jgi:hypothetical protein
MKQKTIKTLALITFLTAGCFSCAKEENTDDVMVSIQIQNWNGEVDPNIVSFALPGIVDARCHNFLPYLSSRGIPEAWNPNDWFIHLVMAKGTDRTKLAPVITLAPGATITPKSGTVLDFSGNVEWTLTAPDGSTVKYYMSSVFVIGDTDEANMVSVKIQCRYTGAIDPNIVSLALPGIVQTSIGERPSYPGYGGIPEAWSPHWWFITLGLTKGTDCTNLDPIITLAPGMKIGWILHGYDENMVFELVDGTGTVRIGARDFTKQVNLVLIPPEGPRTFYGISAHAYGDEQPCVNCPPESD